MDVVGNRGQLESIGVGVGEGRVGMSGIYLVVFVACTGVLVEFRFC